jgi:hypothetical protein
MALVSAGYFSEVSVVDQGGNVSTLGFEFNPATVITLDLANTAQLAMNTLLLAITDSKIKAFSVAERFTEDALTLPTDAQNESKASVSFTKSGYGLGNVKIPAPSNGIFNGTTGAPNNQVDLNDADLIAYTNEFKTGGDYVINDGEFLVELVKGKRIHAKNNNG